MADEDDKPPCKYGINCYRLNEEHKERFSHPQKDRSPEQNESKNSDRQRSESPSKHIDSSKIPPAKRRKTVSSHGSDSDSDAAVDDQPEIESSNGSKTVETPSTVKIHSSPTRSDANTTTTAIAAAETSAAIADATVRCSEFIKESFDKGPHAQRTEYQKLLESPASFIHSKFLVEMPTDFYEFWSFCEANVKANLKPENLFSKFGLSLVGPFDVLAKKFHDIEPFEPGEYLRHWRFYYDPPEFQTIMVKENTGIHYGYWRDEPNGECLIARNDANKNCEITFIADNVFGAALYFLDEEIQLSPFNKANALAMKKSIETYAHSKNISLTSFSAKLKARNLKTVCKTFHKAGLAVPYNRKTDVGYRQLGESDANLKKILSKIVEAKGDADLITSAMDKLQPLITAANIACDESDFGSAIELGTDLFCFGAPELHADALQLLATGYKLVHKPQFIAIVKAHLAHRSKSTSDLSILKKT